MKGRHHHRRRLQQRLNDPTGTQGRTFVVRRTALGYRALVRHPYGRITRLGSPTNDLGTELADREQVARAIAREVLRRPPRPEEISPLTSLLAGPTGRWELHEDDIRTITSRAARAAA